MIKLTKTEMKALAAMESGRVGVKFMPTTVTGLVAKGLAERTFGVVSFRPKFAITEAGRSALRGDEG